MQKKDGHASIIQPDSVQQANASATGDIDARAL